MLLMIIIVTTQACLWTFPVPEKHVPTYTAHFSNIDFSSRFGVSEEHLMGPSMSVCRVFQ
jgi:hypothetical protein